MTLVYVVDEYRTISQTFVVNEICELRRQGVDTKFYALRPGEGVAPSVHMQEGSLAPPFPRWRLTIYLLAKAINEPLGLIRAAYRVYKLTSPRTLRELVALAWVLGHVMRLGSILHQIREPIHLHAHFAGRTSEVCYLLHRILGLTFSITVHAADVYACTDKEALGVRLRSAKIIVCISEFIREHILANGYVHDREHLRVVRCGANLAEFSRDLPVSRDPNKTPIVLTVARLVEKKGIRHLVNAIAFIGREGLTIRCNIVGGGPLLSDLIALTESLGCASNIHFLGTKSHSEIIQLLKEANLFALPCTTAENGDMDGIPTVLIEAMASGVPVISTPVSGIPELIDSGISGLLVPPDDSAALAEAITVLLRDRQAAERMAFEALNKVQQSHDLEHQVELLLKTFTDAGVPTAAHAILGD